MAGHEGTRCVAVALPAAGADSRGGVCLVLTLFAGRSAAGRYPHAGVAANPDEHRISHHIETSLS
jgi:hypothetical protein